MQEAQEEKKKKNLTKEIHYHHFPPTPDVPTNGSVLEQ